MAIARLVGSHDEWLENIIRLLRERAGCPTIILIHNSHGVEIVTSFGDSALAMGMLDIGKIMTARNFETENTRMTESGENAAMESDLDRTIRGKKNEVN